MAVTKAQYSAQSAELINQRLSGSITEAQFKSQWADLNNAYGVSNPELADRQGKFIDESQDLKKGIYDWATGTVNGGPNHDGLYPIRLVTGGTVYWPCIARIIDPLYGSESLAKEYAERAEAALASFLENTDNSAASAALAKASELAAKASETAAATSKTQAEAAKVAAEAARDQALAAKTASEAARDGAVDAAEAAEASAQQASNSAADVETAKTAAVSAKTAAEAAKVAAEAARDATSTMQGDVTSAKAAAQAAATAAAGAKTAAESARDTAVTKATQAEGYATDAALHEAQAANSVSLADNAATFAQQYGQAALNAKNAAESAFNNTVTARSEALQFSNNAAVSANTALGYRNDAQQAATDAAASATTAGFARRDAVNAVTVAQEAAGDAQTSATTAEDARDAAIAAANDAEDAQAITEDARDAALAAQAAAEAAAQQASETVGFDINDYQLLSAKGQANGYASLDATGKVPLSQLDTAVLGGLNYQGAWNAATNLPAIPAAATGNKGQYFIVSVGGTTTINGVSDWQSGDLIMSNGQFWHKLDQTNLILSVNGQTGAVVLAKADVGLGNADNTSDANKPVSTATQAALNLKLDVASKANNTEATTGTDDTKYMTAAKTKAAINGAAITISQVTNLTDALVLKLDASEKGVANGLASLDANGKVPAAQLDLTWGGISGKPSTYAPSAHTHVLADVTDFETWRLGFGDQIFGKFSTYQSLNGKDQPNGYPGLDVNGRLPPARIDYVQLGFVIAPQWGNIQNKPTTFAPSAHSHQITDIINLQTALDAKQDVSGAVLSVAGRTGSVVLTKSDVGLANADNTSDANKPVSTATQTALDAKLAISSKATAGEATAGSDDTKYMTPAKTASAIGAATITQAQVSGLSTALAGKVADGDALKSDRQVIVTPAISGGVLTLDLSLGSVFNVSWTANITSIVLTNVPSGAVSWSLVLVGAGGLSVSWNTTTFKFPGGTAPTLINTTGAHNFMSMVTLNAGSRVNVFFSGATV